MERSENLGLKKRLGYGIMNYKEKARGGISYGI